ncbi:MAG: MFS transporter [Caldilineaceae bacterium SB0661_bin_32]|uniref:MFS transporter n=1 Tax=Caldilineaceae bacterium SB0661_bin_32 TaxID=2605255 RepID=A0A6B1D2Q4_9CHLR|nr:MFS transporter [Caldilineaceae bacterium SB0661_bin_32]
MKSGKIDSRLLTILLVVFVQMLGASLIFPVLPLYAQREFHLSAELITLLASSFFAAQFLSGPYVGRLSDNYGRIPVLIVSQIGTVISFVILAFAPSFGWLFFARVLDGITGGNIIVAQAYITDITPRERRTESLGYILAAFGLGFMFGPALGGALAAAYGPSVPFLVAAVAAGAVVLFTWYALDETLSAEERRRARARRAGSLSVGSLLGGAPWALPLLAILLIAFLGQFALGLLQSTFALFGEAVLFKGESREITDVGIGLLLSVVGVSQLFTQTYLLRRLARRFDEGQLVVDGQCSAYDRHDGLRARNNALAWGIRLTLLCRRLWALQSAPPVDVHLTRGRSGPRQRTRLVSIFHQPVHDHQYGHRRRPLRPGADSAVLDRRGHVFLGGGRDDRHNAVDADQIRPSVGGIERPAKNAGRETENPDGTPR